MFAAGDTCRQRAFIRRNGAHIIMAVGGKPDENRKEEYGAAIKDVARSCLGQAFCHAMVLSIPGNRQRGPA
ncbi:hypothetical protein D3C87_2132620 [compost metagenome]